MKVEVLVQLVVWSTRKDNADRDPAVMIRSRNHLQVAPGEATDCRGYGAGFLSESETRLDFSVMDFVIPTARSRSLRFGVGKC